MVSNGADGEDDGASHVTITLAVGALVSSSGRCYGSERALFGQLEETWR